MIDQIRERIAAGVRSCDIAVLFRTNRQSGYLLEQLMEAGIPFYAKERVPLVYDHWIAKDMICYLKLAAGSRERGLFLQIMNRPLRYLSRDVLDDPQVDLDSWDRQTYRTAGGGSAGHVTHGTLCGNELCAKGNGI